MEPSISEARCARLRSPAKATYPPLHSVATPTLTTAEAAFYLGRRPSTLRVWSQTDSGPLRPARIHGRLAWSTAKVRDLLAAAEVA